MTDPIAICARCHTDVMPHHHHAFGRGGWQHWSPEDCESAVDAAVRACSRADANYVNLGVGSLDGGFAPNDLRAIAWRLEHPKPEAK